MFVSYFHYLEIISLFLYICMYNCIYINHIYMYIYKMCVYLRGIARLYEPSILDILRSSGMFLKEKHHFQYHLQRIRV